MPRRLTPDEFILKATRQHRGRYLYPLAQYNGALGQVIITCKLHGDFSQRACDHLSGHGCPVCGRLRQIESASLTRDEFIARAKAIHGDRYDYRLVLYAGSFVKVTIGCPTHGAFHQTPANHLAGHGCQKCGSAKTPPTPSP